MFGEGVYFARDSRYSVGYSGADAAGQRFMFVAKVLVGKFTLGQRGMKVPPPNYDSVVNETTPNPGIHVVFYDNQCYPDYLIRF